MQFIDLGHQYRRIKEDIHTRLNDILENTRFIMGAEVQDIEGVLGCYTQTSHAIACASGTDGLQVALMALGLKPGDEVITTPFTFFATGEVLALLNLTPVFVDIDPDSYNINPTLIEGAITPRTKAIMPVSLYGQCSDMDAINAIASRHNLPVIEDAAQSFGAEYKGKKSCGLSTIGVTSFFPSKPLGCYGDGGACFTQDAELAKRMEEIRNHGQSKRYVHTRLGINGRLDTLQAAVLLEKIQLFPIEIVMRAKIAQRYAERLPKEVIKPYVAPHNTSVFAQYTIQVLNRDRVQQLLHEQGIPTAVHYPIGLHRQPIMQTMYPDQAAFPHTDYAAQVVMSLPMHPYLTEEDQDKICDALCAALVDYEPA